MTAGTRTVVVGASLAGVRVAEGLRSHGHEGEIVLVGDEQHPPYDRPPLSKQVLTGAWQPERAILREAAELRGRGIEHRASTAAVALDRDEAGGGAVRCHDGSVIRYDQLVIATVARPRLLDAPLLTGVCSLRTLDDGIALRTAFTQAARLTVVGGGFIGAEVASAARTLGLATTMLEASPAPLSRVVGRYVGDACAARYERHGVKVRCDTLVRDVVGGDRVAAVLLDDGSRLPTDLVVVGIGAIPNTEWLTDSGLRLEDGVVCDDAGRAAENVWAVGDVSRWYHPIFGAHHRVEHWTHATEQANAVARSIASGTAHPLQAIPYVWSDQFGMKIQIAGRPSADAALVVIAGDPYDDEFVGVYVRDDVVVGAVAFNSPRAIATTRRTIAARGQVPDVLAAVSG